MSELTDYQALRRWVQGVHLVGAGARVATGSVCCRATDPEHLLRPQEGCRISLLGTLLRRRRLLWGCRRGTGGRRSCHNHNRALPHDMWNFPPRFL